MRLSSAVPDAKGGDPRLGNCCDQNLSERVHFDRTGRLGHNRDHEGKLGFTKEDEESAQWF